MTNTFTRTFSARAFAILTVLSLLMSAFPAPIFVAHAGSGAIWTTNDDCGLETQDTNRFDIGEAVYINGSGFAEGNYDWAVTGQPGGASADPGIEVAGGVYAVDETGSFCFEAYTVASDDDGTYTVDFGNINDNYRVDGVPESVTVELTKKFSGPVPTGYTPDMFHFVINGGDLTDEIVNLTESGKDTAKGTIELPLGNYNIEEVGPDDFVPGEWLPGWYGFGDDSDGGCAGNTYDIDIIIDEDRIKDGTLSCQVDNQWRYGTLLVKKEFVGTTSPYENFEFEVTQGDIERFSGPFNNSSDNDKIPGQNIIIVTEGSYNVTETVYPGYTPSYSGDCDETGEGTMEFEDNQTCTITNTWDDDYVPPPTCDDGIQNQDETGVDTGGVCGNGGGDGDGDEPTYLVFGYVWHDENSNTEWEQGQENSDDNEPDLSGWTVEITNGSTTHSTTTNSEGYYYFYVPAGTWTINEIVQAEWSKTFPIINGHVVEVIDETLAQAEPSIFATVMGMLVPTAHAQTPTTYGPYNFGNVYSGSSGGDGDGDGDRPGGGSSAPRCRDFTATQNGTKVTLEWDTSRGSSMIIEADGDEIFSTSDDDEVDDGSLEIDYTGDTEYELTVSRGSREDTCTADVDNGGGRGGPTPQVLGDQVSAVPLGAANAGAGGAAPVQIPTPTPFVAALFAVLPRRNG